MLSTACFGEEALSENHNTAQNVDMWTLFSFNNKKRRCPHDAAGLGGGELSRHAGFLNVHVHPGGFGTVPNRSPSSIGTHSLNIGGRPFSVQSFRGKDPGALLKLSGPESPRRAKRTLGSF